MKRLSPRLPDLSLFRVLAFSLLFASSAPAQTPDLSLLDRLGSADYAIRQQATREALADPQAHPDQLRQLYAQARTSEQRHRLLSIIRHHTIRSWRLAAFAPSARPDHAPEDAPRHAPEPEFFPTQSAPAIGFSHDIIPNAALPALHAGSKRTSGDAISRGGASGASGDAGAGASGAGASGGGGAVHVLVTLPGFPAYAHLQPGDLIIAIDDQPLPANLDSNLFQDRLRTFKRGETLTLTVHRAGRTERITLQLASLEALTRLYAEGPLLQPPYREQWQALERELTGLAPTVPTLE